MFEFHKKNHTETYQLPFVNFLYWSHWKEPTYLLHCNEMKKLVVMRMRDHEKGRGFIERKQGSGNKNRLNLCDEEIGNDEEQNQLPQPIFCIGVI